MPRRNNRNRARKRHLWQGPAAAQAPTYEQMARALVKAGICSQLILETPYHPTPERTTT